MSYIVQMKNIVKSFSKVEVLHGIDFSVEKGEIHALMGENGAGKSTLMKIMSGAYTKDSGEILVDGQVVDIKTPIDAKKAGIQCIYQELSLIPDITVADNIFLCSEDSTMGIIDEKKIYKKAKEIVEGFNVSLDIKKYVRDIGIGQKYFAEICRCLAANAKVVIMDEPTSAMTIAEIKVFYRIIEELKKRGISIIFISHKLDEIFAICDKVTILRDGNYICTKKVSETSPGEVVRLMLGKEVSAHFTSQKVVNDLELKEKVLEIKNISTSKLKNVSFNLYKGEILGITGLLGAGKTEIARAVYGADTITEGSIFIKGKEEKINHPAKAIEMQIGLVPEDRKGQGLFQEMSIAQNIALINLSQMECFKILVDRREEKKMAENSIKEYNIKSRSSSQKIKNLSGGNQQKVALAKWMKHRPMVLLLDEPTRGIDVGSKEEIYNNIIKMTESGVSVIVFSAEISEILALSDRVVVIYDGRVQGELDGKDATEEKILALASGECV